jgi:hypothetical protein
MKPFDPKLEVSLSDCCNDITSTIPPSMGDGEIVICENCKNECTRQWYPVWEQVERGTYHRIEYKNKDGKIIIV